MLSTNRLRVLALIQFALTFIPVDHSLYRLHYFHMLLQPFIFVATMYHGKWTYPVYFSLSVVLFFDSIVFIPSIVAAERCLLDVYQSLWESKPSPSCPACIEQNVNLLPLTIVSVAHVVIDLMQYSNLRLVEVPPDIDHKERIRIITWFLFVQDTVGTYWLATNMNYFLLVYHPVFNFVVFWVTSFDRINQKKTFTLIGVFAMLIGISDAIIFAGDHIGKRADGQIDTGSEKNFSGVVVDGLMLMYIFTDVLIVLSAFQYEDQADKSVLKLSAKPNDTKKTVLNAFSAKIRQNLKKIYITSDKKGI